MLQGATLFCFLSLTVYAAAARIQHSERESTVAITSLEKNVTTTSGSGNVAAAGSLAPFGDIGIGCGINWLDNTSYGGGLQAGSPDYGLGSGFTVTSESFTVGLGIGLNPLNASADINFVAQKNGTFELKFKSSEEIVCSPESLAEGGKYIVSCRTV
ncbi:hypothetical protein FB567DRAFT_258056 [Paraphoma chrysanthemicola]|uniref:Secreted protein n=1 Tax=Paraphoma chrysanthemicola TaxID=798071 RepID=A0A8K0VRC0_9PLEO|nr:hypothetical protein FB567DRAFT_258056 [Paraphoma chrysanthemicola]